MWKTKFILESFTQIKFHLSFYLKETFYFCDWINKMKL